jgi:hypothetical protein
MQYDPMIYGPNTKAVQQFLSDLRDDEVLRGGLRTIGHPKGGSGMKLTPENQDSGPVGATGIPAIAVGAGWRAVIGRDAILAAMFEYFPWGNAHKSRREDQPMSPEFLYYPDLAAGKRGLSWEEARLLRHGPVSLKCEECPVHDCPAPTCPSRYTSGSVCLRPGSEVRADLDRMGALLKAAHDTLDQFLIDAERYLELKAIEKEATGVANQEEAGP